MVCSLRGQRYFENKKGSNTVLGNILMYFLTSNNKSILRKIHYIATFLINLTVVCIIESIHAI